MRTRLLASVLALAMLFPQSALSWDTRGHMMVAAVAYKKHNRAVLWKNHLLELLRISE